MKTGKKLIKEERRRQISKEGWTAKHDDEHTQGELAHAGRCYCYAASGGNAATVVPQNWPWGRKWWKPSDDPVRNYTKAGALFLAEKDRLERQGRVGATEGVYLNVNECAAAIDRLQKSSN